MAVAERDAELRGARVSFDSLPIVDLSRPGADEALGRAARDIGFFYITGHQVSRELRGRFLAAMRAFFDLPEEEKAATAFRRDGKRVGYMGFGRQRTDDDAEGDLVEGYEIGLELDPDDPDADFAFYGPTPWPARPEGFRRAMLDYMEAMLPLGRRVVAGLAAALGLERDAFAPYHEKPIALLSPRHYPPQSGRITRKRLGVGAHQDYGFVTFVLQDEVGGLQVLDSEGRWIEATPVPDSFVCNIGELMQALSNGRLIATTHRVINDSGRERYSAPFFFNPGRAAVVAPHSALLAPGEAPRFPPVAVESHYEARMRYEY